MKNNDQILNKIKDFVKKYELDQLNDWRAASLNVSYNYIHFRNKLLFEEIRELEDALKTADYCDTIDAMVDIVVVILGTFEIFGWNFQASFDKVMESNMKKVLGNKKTRANKYSFPDLIKPKNWKSPCHKKGCLKNHETR